MLQELNISHFRSIGGAVLQLSPITILVGPNGAGKSNVIDALRFLRDATVDGLDVAVHRRGGLSIVRQYAPTRPYSMSMAATLTENLLGSNYSSRYGLKMSNRGDEPAID